jgi:hypothetical protein
VRWIRLNGEDVPLVITPNADPQLDQCAALAPRRDGRRNGPAAIHDQEIAGAKEAPQPRKVGMLDRPGRAVDHHQANAVAASPA